MVKKHLAQQYPGPNAPDIDFVLGGDPNLPNGGLMCRFAGLYIPIVNLTFNGSAATNIKFDTVEINRQYDGFSDFPLYPLNVIADLNAVLGIIYVHMYSLDVSLPTDPTTSPAYQGTHGDTSYYFFETKNLPLFGPLRTLGVPEKFVDVVEPFFRVIVEMGYDAASSHGCRLRRGCSQTSTPRGSSQIRAKRSRRASPMPGRSSACQTSLHLVTCRLTRGRIPLR